MKKTIISIKALLASSLMLVGVMGNAQQYPWPQDTDYPFGYKPSGVTNATANTAYNAWKAGYLVDGPACAGAGTKRVKFDSPDVHNTHNSKRYGLYVNESTSDVDDCVLCRVRCGWSIGRFSFCCCSSR